MNVDPSGVYMMPCYDALRLTPAIMHLDSSETTVNSTSMNVPVSHFMEVYVWMEESTAVTMQIMDSERHTMRL